MMRQNLVGTIRIEDPVKMLECIVENERFFGYDPYYGDLREAMLNSATRIVEGHKVFDQGFMAWYIDYLDKATLKDLQREPWDFGQKKEFLKEKYI